MDVVGGTYIQPDTNLAGVETQVRQFTEGRRYFEDRFQRKVTAAWQADSFGHTAGLPEILDASGIDSFAFTRPDITRVMRTLPKTLSCPWPPASTTCRRRESHFAFADRQERPRPMALHDFQAGRRLDAPGICDSDWLVNSRQ